MSKPAGLHRSKSSRKSSARNVAYQVALADSAKADANQIYDWVVARAPVRGPEWFEELIDCLYSLEELRYRCPLAREAEAAKREIRCLLLRAQGPFSLRHSARTASQAAQRVLVCEHVYRRAHSMSETLSIRIDAGTKKRLDALAKRSKRSKSFLAAEAISAYVESEEWQLGELHAGMAELDSGRQVSHEKVSKWLKSWGKPGETKAPK
jgi:predicted transcriptional regulator